MPRGGLARMWLTAVIRRKYYPRDERRLAARYPVPPRDMGKAPALYLWLPWEIMPPRGL